VQIFLFEALVILRGAARSLSFSFAGSASDDIIYSENHFSSLRCGVESLFLDAESLSDTHCLHVIDATFVHVDTSGVCSVRDL